MSAQAIRRRPIAAALAVVLLAAACGGGGGDATAQPTTAPTDGASAAPPSIDDATTVAEVLAAVEGMDAEAREAALLGKAEQEGEFVGYFALQIESADAITKGFLEAYPSMREQHFALGGGDTLERILTEGSAGVHNWDVAVVNPEHMKPLREAGLVTRYGGPVLEEIPDEYQDENGEWVNLYVITQGSIYNTTKISEPPTTIEDIADARFKGSFTLDTEDFEWYQMVLESYGDRAQATLEAIKANDPVMIRGGGEQRELVASGEVEMGTTLGDYLIYGMTLDGAPVELQFLDFNVAKHGPMVISNNAPHPAAAVLFMDWALSVEGQQAMHDSTRRSPVNPGVTSQFPDLEERREGVTFFSVDLNNFSENYEQITSDYRALFVD